MPGEQAQEPVTRRTDYHFYESALAGEAIFLRFLQINLHMQRTIL
ncbi:hypothetical protein [Rahnella selenatireducens]